MTHDVIQLTIPGEPVAKGRPRAAVIRGQARPYTPAKTERYESRVALFAQQAMRGRPPFDGALSVEVIAYLPVPRSWSGKRQRMALAGDIRPTGRPDADNVAKSVTDGCNGIVWRDDSRIVDLHVVKRYAADPRVVVTVGALEPQQQVIAVAEAPPAHTEKCAFP